MEKNIRKEFENWLQSKMQEIVTTKKTKENLKDLLSRFEVYMNSYRYVANYEEESKIIKNMYKRRNINTVVRKESSNKYVSQFARELFEWSSKNNAAIATDFDIIWGLSKFLDNYDENREMLNKFHLDRKNNQEWAASENDDEKVSTLTKIIDSYEGILANSTHDNGQSSDDNEER